MAESDAILIVYASTHGQTARIASALAASMHEAGREVEVREASEDPDPGEFAAVVAGGSLHRERHQSELVDWARKHRDSLGARPNAFFSVSLTAAEDSPEANDAIAHCLEMFEQETGWTPDRSEAIAGALQYLEYDRFTRTLMRLMMKRGGHPTDTSRDYDYTDWEEVDRLGREWAALPDQRR